MNVLSLFDGMSCGQQALERCEFNVDNYFASEIDKYAIKVTMANYPNTIQLGSVVNVNGYDLPKIDLLLGGSPCQSFSFVGKRKAMSTKDNIEIYTLKHYLELKSEGYEFEGESYLFWEYMRLLNELRVKNPNIFFLLENVEMGEKWEKVLSKAIDVNGIHMNSSLVSAQNRKRIYWTNIGMQPGGLFNDMFSVIKQPKDKKLLLKDILQNDVDKKYNISLKLTEAFERHAIRHNDKGTGFAFKVKDIYDKANCLRANARICPTDNMVFIANCKYGFYTCMNFGFMCETCDHGDNYENYDNEYIRRLTPIEWERLQTVKDNYTNHVSDSQRYKMIGNGWTIDIICHILNYMK
jgi:DNA (cytosine-5)-methyltransferase 3A